MKPAGFVAAIMCGLAAATGQTAPASGNVCPEGDVTVAQFAVAAGNCLMVGKSIVVSADVELEVPQPGERAGVSVTRTTGSFDVEVMTTAQGQTAIELGGKTYGSAAAVSALQSAQSAVSKTSVAKSPSLELTGCGSAGSYILAGTAWANNSVMFPWYYNAANQPTGTPYTPLSLIQTGFNNVVADSSSCGSGATNASHTYKGTTTSNTANHDGKSVVGWATFSDSQVLGMTWWWNNGSFMTEADIRFDSAPIYPFHMSHYLPVPASRLDFISLAAHEGLHAYGLKDLAAPALDDGQVAWGTLYAGAGGDRRTKRSGDLKGFDLLYS